MNKGETMNQSVVRGMHIAHAHRSIIFSKTKIHEQVHGDFAEHYSELQMNK